jgi:hypothetical protein
MTQKNVKNSNVGLHFGGYIKANHNGIIVLKMEAFCERFFACSLITTV